MNICIISSAPIPPREGIGNYVFNLSRKIIEKGHEITLITRGGLVGKIEHFENIKIFKPVFIPCYPLHVHFHKIFVEKLVKKIDPDILNIHTPLAPTVNKLKLPIITTVHSSMKAKIRNFEPIGLFYHLSIYQMEISCILEQELFKSSDLVTTVSKSVANDLHEDYGIQEEIIKVIYNGVDEKFFIPKYNKNNGVGYERYILSVGRLDNGKGLFDLIECGKYICNRYSDINFIIAGDGALREKLRDRIKKLGLEDRFIFKGHISKKSELVKLYQNATIFAMPSHYEGLPTVILEAMSCGLPIVATAVSGNLDLISSGKNGILIPPKSPERMAEAISILLDDNNLSKKLGNTARKTIEEHYTWEIISNKFIEYCENLL